MSSDNSKEKKLEAARALLMEEENVKQQACSEELNAVLAKYGYMLDVTPPQIILRPAQVPEPVKEN